MSAAADDNMPLTTLAVLYKQRFVDQLLAELPVTNGQSQIVFLNDALAEHRVQYTQCTAAFGQYQATGSLAVQPVRKR